MQYKCTCDLFALVEWVTKVIGSIPEGEQKTHKYTCFAGSALCKGNQHIIGMHWFIL